MINLEGTWVCSFDGYVHDDPRDPAPAPQIGAYYLRQPWNIWWWLFGNVYRQTAGFFPAATMLCLKFNPVGPNGAGSLSGKVKINRGGRDHRENDAVTGGYTVEDNASLGITQGDFYTIYSPPTPDPAKPDIRIDYKFIARSPDEIDWIWWESRSPPGGDLFRASIAQGTLRRVVAH